MSVVSETKESSVCQGIYGNLEGPARHPKDSGLTSDDEENLVGFLSTLSIGEPSAEKSWVDDCKYRFRHLCPVP
jgi:hypothetical protein